MIDNNTFHKIPVTFFEESYNKYQNEVMTLVSNKNGRVKKLIK